MPNRPRVPTKTTFSPPRTSGGATAHRSRERPAPTTVAATTDAGQERPDIYFDARVLNREPQRSSPVPRLRPGEHDRSRRNRLPQTVIPVFHEVFSTAKPMIVTGIPSFP